MAAFNSSQLRQFKSNEETIRSNRNTPPVSVFVASKANKEKLAPVTNDLDHKVLEITPQKGVTNKQISSIKNEAAVFGSKLKLLFNEINAVLETKGQMAHKLSETLYLFDIFQDRLQGMESEDKSTQTEYVTAAEMPQEKKKIDKGDYNGGEIETIKEVRLQTKIDFLETELNVARVNESRAKVQLREVETKNIQLAVTNNDLEAKLKFFRTKAKFIHSKICVGRETMRHLIVSMQMCHNDLEYDDFFEDERTSATGIYSPLHSRSKLRNNKSWKSKHLLRSVECVRSLSPIAQEAEEFKCEQLEEWLTNDVQAHASTQRVHDILPPYHVKKTTHSSESFV